MCMLVSRSHSELHLTLVTSGFNVMVVMVRFEDTTSKTSDGGTYCTSGCCVTC